LFLIGNLVVQTADSRRAELVDLRALARTGPAEISRAESAPGSLTAIASRAAYRSLVAPVARDPPLGTAAVLRGGPALATRKRTSCLSV
jgi:hypothetical protein